MGLVLRELTVYLMDIMRQEGRKEEGEEGGRREGKREREEIKFLKEVQVMT